MYRSANARWRAATFTTRAESRSALVALALDRMTAPITTRYTPRTATRRRSEPSRPTIGRERPSCSGRRDRRRGIRFMALPDGEDAVHAAQVIALEVAVQHVVPGREVDQDLVGVPDVEVRVPLDEVQE